MFLEISKKIHMKLTWTKAHFTHNKWRQINYAG
jgi:hypothetical protein